MQVRHDAQLADLTTLGVGGPIERLVEVTGRDELVAAVRDADDAGRPLLVLGGGSNIVAPDTGWPGDVVLVRTRGISRTDTADGVELEVEAGEPWDDLVAHTVAQQLAGMEALSGIPGSTGATPVQNVGAYGQEVAALITSVRVYDRSAGAERVFLPAELGFAYRDSRLKSQPGAYVVLSVTFLLRASEQSSPVSYAELAKALGVELGETAPLAAVRDAVLGLRRGKGMVWDPADPDSRSAGSFFTNPVVPVGTAVPECPSWPAGIGADGAAQVKLSAAWLVQHSGYGRGTRAGKVGTSSRHSLALTTEPGATATELMAFADRVVAAVREQFGVTLVPEPTAVRP
ncbi:UDP-N-acetylmuramate dehydrogenase [Modestobacter sp. VKM Ac-2979]|uniref:UDP-N-acetylmuramate dehydrogenase n=1 Tax=unclassified Modestobacter TaxID=2643866 RepID=UPI0022AB77BB|nr:MULTISPECIES: UDP-N-acetylmuramate dehydrogenase [unclassified Modestobacter]MCZ2811450.1 UDP-N-acetylmuramate dehydrogenase [Modestobacter sp. VKM Ac-2979]MCZ2840964.1 UDP-N-acetylmuramate dehydrogenase [Modestobacter sp. VKM Ac-2980]